MERFFRCLPGLGVSSSLITEFCITQCANLVDRHTLLSAGLLDLLASTETDETVARLELLQGLSGVVDESEAGALATTVLCAEAEDGNLVLVGLVQVGKLLTELVLGDVGAVGVQDVPIISHQYPVPTRSLRAFVQSIRNPISSSSILFFSVFSNPFQARSKIFSLIQCVMQV